MNFNIKFQITSSIIIVFLLSSCVSFNKNSFVSLPKEEITKENLLNLNGLYSINHDSIIGNPGCGKYNRYETDEDYLRQKTFLSLLPPINRPKKYWETIYKHDIKQIDIKLEFTSNSKVLIDIYHNDSLLFTRKFHGYIKNGYFYFRRLFYIIPFYPIFMGHVFEQTRLGIKEEFLLIDYRTDVWVFAFMGGTVDKGSYTAIFRKINAE